MTQKQKYLAAGLKLLPSGRVNNYQYVKLVGRLGSMKDSTWVKVNGRAGYHKCCKSKRDYYHKINCNFIKEINSDDLSDIKL